MCGRRGPLCNGGMMCGGNTAKLLGLCAAALGAGILIAVIFPVGVLMFLFAFVLIACGIVCMSR